MCDAQPVLVGGYRPLLKMAFDTLVMLSVCDCGVRFCSASMTALSVRTTTLSPGAGSNAEEQPVSAYSESAPA